jgi:hypothetical protein
VDHPHFTPEIAEEVLRRIAEGHSLREIARTKGMPAPSTVIGWSIDRSPPFPDFGERYLRAREIGWQIMAEEIPEIVDDATNDWMERRNAEGDVIETVLNTEHVNRSRLRMEARKWLLSKRLPKTFGDRTVLAGDPDAPLIPPDTRPDPSAFLKEWMPRPKEE